jgi:sarcosine oxidase subunit beta
MGEVGLRNPDVVVVGGGIVGASCAYFLARAGARVVLLERFGLAAGTSSACQSNVSAGIGARGRQLAYFRACVAVYAELRSEGMDFGWTTTPRLVVALTDSEATELRADVAIVRETGVAVDVWTGDPRQLEPRLAPTVPLVAIEHDAAQVNPMQATVELAQHARRAGARIVTGCAVTTLIRQGSRVIGVDSSAGRVTAEAVLLACGAWSRELAATAEIDLPVWPRKGHILVTEPRPRWTDFNIAGYAYEATLGHGFVSSEAHDPTSGDPEVGTVLQPLPQGQMLLGSSREFAGWDGSLSRSRLTSIARAGVAMLPTLAHVRVIRSYAGFRPWSPDGEPLLGPVPEAIGLWVATGHGGGGITGAPLAGQLIAELRAGGLGRIDPRPYRPERFDLRLKTQH